jgi:hypothetical protein
MAESQKCAVKGCMATATMVLASTLQGPRGPAGTALDYVCPAHASRFKPGTRYTADGYGIKFGGFRPNCTVQTVGPIE